jgi:NTE family protein
MLLDGGLVNPVPIAPTLNDTTELTVAVDLSGPIESRPPPLPRSPIPEGKGCRRRIHAFVESLRHSKAQAVPVRGIFDIVFASMEAMQNTIARLRLAAYSPDVTVEIPRNACGLLEYWRAKELIALGRERTARAFSAAGR